MYLFSFQNDFFDDDVYHDDDDDDYVPPTEKPKNKFKKPKLSDIKVFKGKKPIVKKVKVIKQYKQNPYGESSTIVIDDKKSTTITCCKYLHCNYKKKN